MSMCVSDANDIGRRGRMERHLRPWRSLSYTINSLDLANRISLHWLLPELYMCQIKAVKNIQIHITFYSVLDSHKSNFVSNDERRKMHKNAFRGCLHMHNLLLLYYIDNIFVLMNAKVQA